MKSYGNALLLHFYSLLLPKPMTLYPNEKKSKEVLFTSFIENIF